MTPDSTDIRPGFNVAGLLESIAAYLRGSASLTDFVNNIDYDEKGWRKLNAAGAEVQLDADDRPIHDVPHPNDPSGLRLFEQAYEYDAIGNILSLAHTAVGNSSASWTRGYAYPTDSNRLDATSLPGDDLENPGTFSATYTHDAHGNMTVMPHLDALDWDYADRLQHCDLGGGGDVYFVYDGSGERVRKVYVHGTTVEERIYLGGYEVYRKSVSGTLDEERQTVHIADDQRRVWKRTPRSASWCASLLASIPHPQPLFANCALRSRRSVPKDGRLGIRVREGTNSHGPVRPRPALSCGARRRQLQRSPWAMAARFCARAWAQAWRRSGGAGRTTRTSASW